MREIARLQGFPDTYPVAATLPAARRHLGNAVPPTLGMAVLWRVLASLDLSDAHELPNALRPRADAWAPYATVLGALAAAAGLGVPRVRGLAKTS